jgi:hypothetical protein
MGFFSHLDNIHDSKESPLPFDRWCASKLRKEVTTKTRTNGAWKISSWAGEFRRLRVHMLSNDQERLEKVLNWYCEHIGDKGVPWAYSAKAFHKKFVEIEKAYERWLKDHPVLEISEDAKSLYHDLKTHLRWPNTEQLLPAIQKTLDGFKSFSSRLWKYIESKPRSGQDVDTAIYLSKVMAPQFARLALTTRWFSRINGYIAHYGNRWEGNLLKMAFDGDLDNEHFQKEVLHYLTQYCGSSAAKWWDRLKKEIQ